MFRNTRLPLFLCALLALSWSADADAKRKKKKRRRGEAPTGWVESDKGQPACYYSPVWDDLNEIDRRMKRAEALDEIFTCIWEVFKNIFGTHTTSQKYPII